MGGIEGDGAVRVTGYRVGFAFPEACRPQESACSRRHEDSRAGSRVFQPIEKLLMKSAFEKTMAAPSSAALTRPGRHLESHSGTGRIEPYPRSAPNQRRT